MHHGLSTALAARSEPTATQSQPTATHPTKPQPSSAITAIPTTIAGAGKASADAARRINSVVHLGQLHYRGDGRVV